MNVIYYINDKKCLIQRKRSTNTDSPSGKGLHAQNHIYPRGVNNYQASAELYPLMTILTLEHIEHVCICLPGVVTTIDDLIQETSIPCFSANDLVMKE